MKQSNGRIDRLERIIEAQAKIVQADLSLDAFMQLVVDTLQGLTGAKGAVVELVDGDYMVYRSASGAICKHVGLRLLRANSLSGLCVAKAEILRCDDAETDARVDAAACRTVGVRSMVCTPLFEEGVPVGVLKVMSEQAYGFDDDDVQTLGLMGAALGSALGKQVAFDALSRLQAELQASEERMRTILEHANDSVISIDSEGVVSQWNRSAERLFGWAKSEVIGRHLVDLVVPPAMRGTFDSALAQFNAGAYAVADNNLRRELPAVDRHGKELTVEVSINANRIGGRLELTAFLHDISERKQLEEALRHMALSDGLTGLPNRRRFMDVFGQAIARQRRQASGLGLFYMDLNGFKQINDTRGHDVGDQVLKEFAGRVAGCLRETDTLARLGGDEFVVIAEGIRTVEQAESLAGKIVGTLDNPVPGTGILMATSIGIRICGASADVAQALREADLAMYQAKQNRSGGSSIAIFAEGCQD